MAIIITDHSWSQDALHVCLSVPLHGVAASKADVLHTEKYVKISFAPFLFEVLLYDQVDPFSVDIKFDPKRMFATFAKAQPNHEWPQLSDDGQRDREYMRQVRREAVDRYLQIVDERDSKDRAEKFELHHECVREQMALDGSERERIKAAKSKVINDLERELEAWKRGGSEEELLDTERHAERSMGQSSAVEKSSADSVHVDHPDSTDDDEAADIGQKELNDVLREQMQLEDDETLLRTLSNQKISRSCKRVPNTGNGDDDASENDDDGEKAGKSKHAVRRNLGDVIVEFTPRVFPTPERESARQMEDEWLMKQSEARAVVTDQVVAHLRPEERNPLWLLNKATKLEQVGDYESAYEALTYAIRLSALRKQANACRLSPLPDDENDEANSNSSINAPVLPQLWLGRARCQIKRRNFHKCIEDCTTALEFHLHPPCEANRELRGEAHLSRGNALLQLELPQEALVEIQAAYNLLKNSHSSSTDEHEHSESRASDSNVLRQSVSEKDGDSRSRLMHCAALLARAKEAVEKGEETQWNTTDGNVGNKEAISLNPPQAAIS